MGAVEEASTYSRLLANLAELRLDEMAAALPGYVRMAADGEKDLCSALYEMTEAEVAQKARRDFVRRVRSAGFPYVKTLADFDFSFQPSVPRGTLEELSTLAFLERAVNVLLVGSPGVGKTHLAVALGVEAVKARKEVRFVDCARLVDDLKDASMRGILAKRIKFYAHATLLVVDEVGYLGIDPEGAKLFFQLVSARYEKRSTIVTTNVGVGAWAGVFGDATTASAIADRLCHHCVMIKITGRSYRLRDLQGDEEKGGAGSEE